MSSPIPVVQKLLHRTRNRIRRARPRVQRLGSILILVVALLVLVAIIGTAALSTNTIDRYATGQNNANTQIDLLVEGVKNMAKSVIVSDVKDSAAGVAYYRPASGLSRTYEHWDMPLMMYLFTDPNDANIHPPPGADPFAIQLLQAANDAWMSPRYPSLQDARSLMTFQPTNTGSQILGANPPVWDCIGAPLEAANGVPPAGQKLFDTPGVFDNNGNLAPSAVARGYNYRVTDRTPAQGATVGTVINALMPTFITYTVNGQPVTMPAWKFQASAGNPEYYYIAGDADGDGIADSGLKRLSVGEVNGLTYFYSVRIIDNGSAINVNTAWSRDHEFLGDLPGSFAVDYRAAAGTMPATAVPQITNFFPSNIGLAELLRTSTSRTATNLDGMQNFPGPLNELGNIDAYRFGGGTAAYMRPTGVVDNQLSGTATRLGGYAFVDKATGASTGSLTDGRNDFAYNTMNELLWFVLGRRLDNPGVVEKQPKQGAQVGQIDTRFRAFSVSDAASIAYRFVMVNPDASKSLLEQATASGANPGNPNTPPATPQTMDSLFWSAGNKTPNALRNPPVPPIGNTFNMANQRQYPSTLYGVGYWFADNFDWDHEFSILGGAPYPVEIPDRYRNRRSMFTTYNPVANQVPTITAPQVAPLPAYAQSAYVKASVNTATYLDLASAFLGVMTEGQEDPYRVLNSSGRNPTPPWASPNVVPPPDDMYSYTGMKFSQPVPTDGGANALNPGDLQSPSEFPAAAGDTNPDRMFRSSIRENILANIGSSNAKYNDATNSMNPVSNPKSTNAAQFSPKSMRKLRSYLAAANTASMRYPSHRVLPQRVQAVSSGNDPLVVKINGVDTPVDLFTYGAEPQPFITEVYANTDTNRSAASLDASQPTLTQPNGEPYVAIELFWPYQIGATPPLPANAAGQPWDMRPYGTGSAAFAGWSIGLISREQTAGPGARNNGIMNVTVIGTVDPSVFAQHAGAFFDVPTTTDPRYGSYIILENYDDSGSDTTSPVHFRPRSSGLPYTGPISANHTANTTTPPVKSVYIRNLAKAIKRGSLTATPGADGGEIVIFRPVRPAGETPAGNPGTYVPPRPIDSFDFTGLANDSIGTNVAYVWHYARQGKIAATGVGEWWSFIYPGRYNGGLGATGPGIMERRHQGTQAGRYRNPTVNPADPTTSPLLQENDDPFDPFFFTAAQLLDPPITLGTKLTVTSGITPQNDDNASPTATYPRTFKTQLLNYDQPGWNQLTAGSPVPNKFPYGAFARNSDIMQIPYFGAYWITPAVPQGAPLPTSGTPPFPTAIEVNSMSMDSSFCEDTDLYDDEGNPSALTVPGRETFEQLGRFCPLTTILATPLPGAVAVDDLDPTPGRTYRYCLPEPQFNNASGLPNSAWRYRWTTRLFDYLTVQDPQTDSTPNVDPQSYTALGAPKPEPLSNDGSTPPGGDPVNVPAIANSENAVPIQGLININTASWRVLSAINFTPFAPSDTTNRDRCQLVIGPDGEFEMQPGANQIDDNIELCKAIEWWRDGKDAATSGSAGAVGPKGPFISLYDLYRVKALKMYFILLNQSAFAAVDPDDADGDYSPHDLSPLVQSGAIPPVDQVRHDFEERFSLLNRVGNLLTTRSDCYTVYIVVQGWRNVNDPTKPPELVVQRRAAFIADRSGVTATGGALKITNVASE